ncbi:MAG: DUF4294 domain-containing protein [Mangrovibacterium sp.]
MTNRLSAQENCHVKTTTTVIHGDTIPQFILDELKVNPMPNFESRRFARRYWRLVGRVKKTYPYAVIAAKLMDEYNEKYELAGADKSERRKYLKQMEKELFNTYGSALRKMSISDGRVLIKLIDRETNSTSYALIKDLKGGTSAFFWQGIAKLFGNDLKSQYNPEENFEDEHIEQILLFLKYKMI